VVLDLDQIVVLSSHHNNVVGVDSDQPSEQQMQLRIAGTGFLIASMAAAAAQADDSDVAEGKKLYTSQCMVCHGDNSSASWTLPVLALQEAGAVSALDVGVGIGADWLAVGGASASSAERDESMHLVVAPPFGPNLRGIVGRVAGSVKGFAYSSAFTNALKGMEWNESALDVWLTDTQRWVPGVTMFYKQKDPDIRRKIVEYLKANP
jgi:cytochrome c2